MTMNVTCRYGDFSIPERDDLIADSLRLYGEWAQIEIDILAQFIAERDTVIDAGAFIGTHTRAFSKFVGPAGRVLAFEPNNVAFGFLEDNVSRSQYANISAIQHALGSSEETRFLGQMVNGNAGQTALTTTADYRESRPVTVRPLDALGIPRVSFIKADVEGMELSILEGASKLINTSKPVIFVEANTLDESVSILQWSSREDYIIFGIITPAFNPNNFNLTTDNVFGVSKETGLLLISRERFTEFAVKIHRSSLPKIATVDDLALLLLHKPQYPYEVLDKSPASRTLGIIYPAPSLTLANKCLAAAEQAGERAQDLAQQRQATIASLRQQLSIVEETSKTAQMLAQDQQATINELKRRLAVAEHARQQTCQLAQKRSAAIDELEKTRIAAERARQEAEERTKERQATIDAIYASTSWRATALLRHLKRLCAGLPSLRDYYENLFEFTQRALTLTGSTTLSLRPLASRRIRIVIGLLNRRNMKISLRYISRGQIRALYRHVVCAISRAVPIDTPSPLVIPHLSKHEKNLTINESTDIIIPVYNGMEFLDKLFSSIQKNTRSPYRLIIIDDGSPDKRVWPYLQQISKNFRAVTLLRNDENLGFVSTCNRAMRLARGHFVICNTDVEVPPGWLERLLAPIYSEANVATVTPFTNAGTICSFPIFVRDNEILNGWSVDAIDAFFARMAVPPAINIPTGVGFCMAFNQFAVQEIGLLDELTFQRGYGEENDWCMRASARGYVHRLAANLFIYHKHGGSFIGEERAKLRESNFQKLVTLYPHYQSLIDDFIRRDPAKALRDFFLLYIVAHLSERKTVLIVDHAMGGGANLYRERLTQRYLAQGRPVLLLTYELHTQRMRLDFSFLEYKTDFVISSLDDLVHLCRLISLGEIFYNNAVSYSNPLTVAEALLSIKKASGAKLTVSFHDYFAICPSYTLIGYNGLHCNLPDDINLCEQCLQKSKLELVKKPEGGIIRWRATWGALIADANTVLCFSEDSARLVKKAYPRLGLKIVICPHKVDYLPPRLPLVDLGTGLHIGVVGSINYAKGADIVRRIGELVETRNLKIQITVVGVVSREVKLPKSIRVTGAYTREGLADILEHENINICFLPSIWPETFSYVTEEVMQLKMPLCCFDLGAPADRVHKYALGRIVTSFDPDSILKEIVGFYEELRQSQAQLQLGGPPSAEPWGLELCIEADQSQKRSKVSNQAG